MLPFLHFKNTGAQNICKVIGNNEEYYKDNLV